MGLLTPRVELREVAKEELSRNIKDRIDALAMGAMAGTVVEYDTSVDDQEYQMRIAELTAHVTRLQHELETPAEDTEEFRDFVVWLCGFTERHAPPDPKDWEALRDKTKNMAAHFALRARDKARADLKKHSAIQSLAGSSSQNTATQNMYQQQVMASAAVQAAALQAQTFSTAASQVGSVFGDKSNTF